MAARGLADLRWLALLVVAAVAVAPPRPASAQVPTADLKIVKQPDHPRVALVIGNSNYKAVGRLDNPKQDAEAVAAALRKVGFELIGDHAQLDLDKRGLEQTIREFGLRLQGGSVGFFYYSGHGLELGGRNFLVPVDGNPQRAADADFELVDVDLVLRQLRDANNQLNMIVLDACRNNPFGGRGVRGGSGLAEIKDRPSGTIISYATAPGMVARDGAPGTNSPYTAALVAAIQTPGLGPLETFNRVAVDVETATQRDQQPWVSSTAIRGQFVFVPDGSKVTIETPPAAPSAAASPTDRDALFWASVKDSRNPAQLQAYLDQFPQGTFAGLAKVMIDDLKKPQVAAAPAKREVAPTSPAERVPATEKSAFDPSGAWRTDDGYRLILQLEPDGALRGDYGDGSIAGRLNGRHFEGTWREPSGDRACRRTADGAYWGRVTFDFAPDGRTAKGRWGYCDDAPRDAWNASR